MVKLITLGASKASEASKASKASNKHHMDEASRKRKLAQLCKRVGILPSSTSAKSSEARVATDGKTASELIWGPKSSRVCVGCFLSLEKDDFDIFMQTTQHRLPQYL